MTTVCDAVISWFDPSRSPGGGPVSCEIKIGYSMSVVGTRNKSSNHSGFRMFINTKLLTFLGRCQRHM